MPDTVSAGVNPDDLEHMTDSAPQQDDAERPRVAALGVLFGAVLAFVVFGFTWQLLRCLFSSGRPDEERRRRPLTSRSDMRI